MERIFVGHKLVDKCEKKAKGAAKSHVRRGTREKYSKGNLSLERKIAINRFAFIAECGMCIYLGLDPFKAIDWQTRKPDDGYDLKGNGFTIDVKASDSEYASRLMWPVKKNDKLDKAADALVFARVLAKQAEPLGQYVELVGWRTSDYFRRMKWTANSQRGIVDGTFYLNEKDLDPMDYLKQHLNTI